MTPSNSSLGWVVFDIFGIICMTKIDVKNLIHPRAYKILLVILISNNDLCELTFIFDVVKMSVGFLYDVTFQMIDRIHQVAWHNAMKCIIWVYVKTNFPIEKIMFKPNVIDELYEGYPLTSLWGLCRLLWRVLEFFLSCSERHQK